MREMIDNIRNTDPAAGLRVDVEIMKTDIINILSNYANVTNTITEIQNDISATDQKYDNLLNDEISPIRSKVYELMNKLATLNNALAALNVNYTSDQINEMFNDFITTVPTDMVSVVTAIRDDILAILDRSGIGNGDLSASDLFYISPDTDVIDAIKTN